MKAYNATQGLSSPPAQVVSITNTGEGKLYGNMDGAETNRAWLSPSLTHRVVSPGQTEQVTILAITQRESFCGKRLSFLRFSSEC